MDEMGTSPTDAKVRGGGHEEGYLQERGAAEGA